MPIQIPDNVKRFRYENMFFGVNSKKEYFDFYVKNTETNSHLHLFKHGPELGLVFTKEDKRGTPEEHTTIVIEKFTLALSEIILEFLMGFERIEKDDHHFRGKLVQLVTSPEIFLDKIRERKAYFAHKSITHECNFEDIDSFQPGFGVIVDNDGNELGMLFSRGGEIWYYDLIKFKALEENFYKKHKELDFVN